VQKQKNKNNTLAELAKLFADILAVLELVDSTGTEKMANSLGSNKDQ
jgi:hypothetical protein